MAIDIDRNIFYISLSQFGMVFSFFFVMIFMPFLIFKISPFSPQTTLLWVGLIVSAPSFVTAISSTFWGSLTSHLSIKWLYLGGLFSHAVFFLAMGFTSNLHLLLLLRIAQGIFGGVSTIGLIYVSSVSSREKVSENIGIFQNSITLGQLLGPPVGSFLAAGFGYRYAFVIASVTIFAVLIFCYLKVSWISQAQPGIKSSRNPTINKNTIIGWMLCFTATVQLMFLPSILPVVLEKLNMEKIIALKWAGIVVMLYTLTAILGTYFWTKYSTPLGKVKTISLIIILGTLFQSLLSLSQGIVDFLVIRMLQTGFIAAAMPLVISIFARELKGSTIGFLNSARLAGVALGPMIATSILSSSNLTTLYLFISGMTLLALLGFRLSFGVSSECSPPTKKGLHPSDLL